MDEESPPQAKLDQLVEAHAAYGRSVASHYDEVLNEVTARVEESGSVGKLDIGALLFWKRLRADTPWVAKLNDWADADVRAITSVMVEAVRDDAASIPASAKAGRSSLSELDGFKSGDALASALMLAAAPKRMAVYDRRSHAGLRVLGIEIGMSRGRYSRYMSTVESLMNGVNGSEGAWLPRDVDVALYQLGGPAGG